MQLTSAEQRDFELIIRNARASCWLDQLSTVVVRVNECTVSITVSLGVRNQTKQYDADTLWPYRFLYDLAHGNWQRTSPFATPELAAALT
jgi:hypothetical protein